MTIVRYREGGGASRGCQITLVLTLGVLVNIGGWVGGGGCSEKYVLVVRCGLKGNIKENLPLFWSQVMMMMMMTAKVMVITLIVLFFFKTILLGRRPFKSREMECDRV